MNHKRTSTGLCCILITAVALAGASCAKKSADVELAAARKAIADAQAKRASDCAHDTYQAAEAALDEASKLADAGKIDEAKAKANQAKDLAENASASVRPDCTEKKDVAAPSDGGKSEENASATMKLNPDDVLQTIYFDYNDASIREDGKSVLSKVADILTKQRDLAIEIEGHCDVRGSTEYNLQLGERRARSVEKYLTAQGVNPKQLSIISYGEERPVDLGTTEEAHARNRRAELHKQK